MKHFTLLSLAFAMFGCGGELSTSQLSTSENKKIELPSDATWGHIKDPENVRKTYGFYIAFSKSLSEAEMLYSHNLLPNATDGAIPIDNREFEGIYISDAFADTNSEGWLTVKGVSFNEDSSRSEQYSEQANSLRTAYRFQVFTQLPAVAVGDDGVNHDEFRRVLRALSKELFVNFDSGLSPDQMFMGLAKLRSLQLAKRLNTGLIARDSIDSVIGVKVGSKTTKFNELWLAIDWNEPVAEVGRFINESLQSLSQSKKD